MPLLREHADSLESGSAEAVLEALDGLRTAITIYDRDERLTYANQHFNYLFRSLPYRGDLIGISYEDMIRLEIAGGEIAPRELSEGADAFVARRRRQFALNDYRPLDIRLTDGRIIEIKTRKTPSGGWIAMWNDATFARHMLLRLEDTIELSADAFAFWNSADRLILCNAEFAHLHGIAKTDDAARMGFTDLLSQAVRRNRFHIEGDVAAWMDRRQEAHRSPAGALTVTMSDGKAYLLRERATRDGGRVSVLTDVTDRHRAESALAEQTRALHTTKEQLVETQNAAKAQAQYLADLTRRLDAAEAEADTAKTALLRTMSHELKTPLNAILGFADLLRTSADRFPADQIGEYAGLIHVAGGNLLRLINQILDLTKIAARRYVLRKAPVSAAMALATACDAQGEKAENKQIVIDMQSVPVELSAEADETALNAIVTQLVENAVTFTQNGGTVRLSARREGDFVRFIVEDNGPGVSEADIARILEPFEQAGRGTANHAAGAGLGLPLVKALAELHGGMLSIASVLGEGFTATLDIPAA